MLLINIFIALLTKSRVVQKSCTILWF